MDQSAATGLEGVTYPPVPRAGLAHVLSAWSGSGQLLDALAAVVADDSIEREWSELDVRRRAHRVLFALLVPHIERLPRTVRQWRETLPAEAQVARIEVATPRGRLDMRATRALGWPPPRFVARERGRVAENLLARTTVWVLRRLRDIAEDARRVDPSAVLPLQLQLTSAAVAVNSPPLAFVTDEPPDRAGVDAVARAGRPWSTIAAIARELRAADGSLDELAARLIEPDDRLRWRLFHLAVLGEVLRALAQSDFDVLSLRPLSSSSAGPSYRAAKRGGRSLDLWFEAASIWRWCDADSPYRELTAGMTGAGSRPLGPDILLVQGARALVVECKYSSSAPYVASGYEQVTTYGAELRVDLMETVACVVVGPDGVVERGGRTRTVVGRVDLLPAGDVRRFVSDWLAGDE